MFDRGAVLLVGEVLDHGRLIVRPADRLGRDGQIPSVPPQAAFLVQLLLELSFDADRPSPPASLEARATRAW